MDSFFVRDAALHEIKTVSPTELSLVFVISRENEQLLVSVSKTELKNIERKIRGYRRSTILSTRPYCVWLLYLLLFSLGISILFLTLLWIRAG